MMAELTGVDPDQVQIGMPVRASFIRIDDELVLPGWRADERAAPGALPELAIEVTPTLVVATAIATRDFYPVHHDHEFAVRSGSKDIFLNILTTTGLVQRYVTDWAGPGGDRAGSLHPARRAVLRRRHADVLRPGDAPRDIGGRRPGDRRHRQLQPRQSRDRHRPARAGRERADDLRGSGDRRDRGHRVLQGLRPQRAEARGRGGPGRAGRRRADAGRRGRPGHVQHGQQRRDRGGPRARRRRADVLQPDRLRRRSRLRDRAPGRDGGRDRRGERRGLLPGAERAVRPPVRPGLGRRGAGRDVGGDRQRLALPDGPGHPGRDGGDGGPPVHARLRRDQRGLRRCRGRRPQARRHQPGGLVLPAADHAGRAPGVTLDLRAAAAAGLLPGNRRRGRCRGHQPRAAPVP